MNQYEIENPTNNYKFMKSKCNRMIQLIHFELYQHIFNLKTEQDRIMNGDFPISRICSPQNFVVNINQLVKEGQKYREMVTQSLIVDGWREEANTLIEQNRDFQYNLCIEQRKPEEFFQYDLYIINYSTNLDES